MNTDLICRICTEKLDIFKGLHRFFKTLLVPRVSKYMIEERAFLSAWYSCGHNFKCTHDGH